MKRMVSPETGACHKCVGLFGNENIVCPSCKEVEIYCGKKMCSSCYHKHEPIKMRLAESIGEEYLYNFGLYNYEYFKDVKSFEECGWHVRKIYMKPFKVIDGYKKVLVLEYRGDKNCNRCPSTHHDPNAAMCTNYDCSPDSIAGWQI